jgi:hypothetical protein
MKYATKLMVVPYQPRLENPVETQIFSIDQEMEKILHDKSITDDDVRIKLYHQA